MKSIRVLIVDDERLFVQCLKQILELNSDDIEVVGIAYNGKEAEEYAEHTHPDIILMDVYMPGGNGVDATKEILSKHQDIRIIMLSTFDKDEYVSKALQYGADGYLLKDISPVELIASIHALHEGEGVMQISPSIAAKLVQKAYDGKVKEKKKFQYYDTLSKREKEIFALLADGYDNAQIAERLFIAEQTVRNYVHSIYSKLNVENRFQIIQIAKEINNNI